MTSQQERAAERHREKLAAIQEQIDKGTLTVRQMTAKERAKYPPRSGSDKPAKRPRR